MVRLVLPLLLFAAGAASAGEVYRWTDAEGKVHYTSDLERVPAAQREGARASAGRPPVMRIPSRPPAAPSPAPEKAQKPKSEEATEPVHGGRNEAGWRAEAARLRDAVAALEAEAEACRAEGFHRAAGAGGRAAEGDSADACGRVRSELDMNRRWLDALEEDAHRAGAPPGWLRD